MEYQYPLSMDWSTEEIIDVVKFYESVEKAYEKSIERDEFMNLYKRFKEIVPSKAEEKTIDKEFLEMSGYSIYRTQKKARESAQGEKISMNR
ncbi:UPF0223 family protein [Jeotgalibacillus salarius]|uniref:UPF0223 protein E2626_12490 n=1 Tax=Jeotgalibacillus salarius TaxID=546023 RepID=A0A4Y8LFG0_9BACL|nr:UPF0223 family protein [Jeotgalibacillus salarius]TFE00293.1 UPF0223 family protein [Jeotgalibacillus salarius]